MAKVFSSAFGHRTAFTYLGWLGDELSADCLQAEIVNGAQNRLATVTTMLSSTMTDEELTAAVDHFVVAVDTAVHRGHPVYR